MSKQSQWPSVYSLDVGIPVPVSQAKPIEFPPPWKKKIEDSQLTAFLATLEAPPFPRQLQRKTTPSPALTAELDG